MELANPIKFDELLSKPILFKIDAEQAIEHNDEDLLNDAENERMLTQSPWMYSFDDLRKAMERIGNQSDLCKKIIRSGSGDSLDDLCTMNCRVYWTYDMYMQAEEYPFDSSYSGSSKPRISERDELLPGIWLALRTMRKGEEAHFVIGYRLMYGELGNTYGAYFIKPKADILLVAKLIDFQDIGTENPCEQLTSEQLHDYPTLKPQLIEMQTKMMDFYDRRVYGSAIKIGLDVFERVTFCDISISTEASNDRDEFLTGILVTLVDCYVHVQKYTKALDMIEKLRRLTNVERFAGVLVNEAIALAKVGDNYLKPIELLRTAQRRFPGNQSIRKTLTELHIQNQKYMAETKAFMMKAIQAKPSTPPTPAPAPAPSVPQTDAITKLTEMMKLFDDTDIGNGVPLVGCTNEELSLFKAAINQTSKYALKMTKGHDGQSNHYTIIKAD